MARRVCLYVHAIIAVSKGTSNTTQFLSKGRAATAHEDASNASATAELDGPLRHLSLDASEVVGPCLCVFDIDRTLTGASDQLAVCPRNHMIEGVEDDAYANIRIARGNLPWLTLSALAHEGISSTFCGGCYLGVCSAGDAGGEGSKERDILVTQVLRTPLFDALVERVPDASRWSHGGDIQSPLVYNKGNKFKQDAVQGIHDWYEKHGVRIPPKNVYFFGDRTENIEPFRRLGFNAREISCGSRDPDLCGGNGMVGFCGATPEEIVHVRGIHQCPPSSIKPQCKDTPGWTSGHINCRGDGCTETGWTCQGYELQGWCANGRRATRRWVFGRRANYPERNCCACGGGGVDSCRPRDVSRRRRASDMCSCRRRVAYNVHDMKNGLQCQGHRVVRSNEINAAVDTR